MLPINLDELSDGRSCERFAVSRLVTFLESGKRVQRELADYLATTPVRPAIEPDLLLMFEAIDDVVMLIEHCEQREIVVSSTRAPAGSGWSYIPWMHEKASRAKKDLKTALHYFKMSVEAVKLKEGAPWTPEQWLRSFVHGSIESSVRYAKTIFEEIFEDNLVIGKQAGMSEWSGIDVLEIEPRPSNEPSGE